MFSVVVLFASLVSVAATSCTPSYGGYSVNDELTSPDLFQVTMSVSNSDTSIVIEVNRSWSPIGADHFFTLIRDGYYDCAAFYKVVSADSGNSPFIQTGIAADPTMTEKWENYISDDDASVHRMSNTLYTVAYVPFDGYGTRSTYFMIHLGDNSYLDNSGYYPFGEVVEGFDAFSIFDSDLDVDAASYKEGGNDWLFSQYSEDDVTVISDMDTDFSSLSSGGHPDRTGSWIFGTIMIALSSAAVVYASIYLYRYIKGLSGYDTMSPDSTGSTERIIALNTVDA